jgi:hypothetical protein
MAIEMWEDKFLLGNIIHTEAGMDATMWKVETKDGNPLCSIIGFHLAVNSYTSGTPILDKANE